MFFECLRYDKVVSSQNLTLEIFIVLKKGTFENDQ